MTYTDKRQNVEQREKEVLKLLKRVQKIWPDTLEIAVREDKTELFIQRKKDLKCLMTVALFVWADEDP